MRTGRKRIKVNLLVWILLAIGAGIGCAYFMPLWAGRVFMTFNAIFGQFLGFMIPLIIIGFVVPAISDVGSRAGKMLLLTAGIAYIFTSLSGFYSYFIGSSIFPNLVGNRTQTAESMGAHDMAPYLTIEMPPLMTVMTALVLSFLLGLCMAYLKTDTMRKFTTEFRDCVELTINRLIIPLLPLYIFGIFLNMTMAGDVTVVLKSFAAVIGIIFAMTLVLLVLQFCIAGVIARRNPLKMLWQMLPAYFTALGTQSSASTIPVTLRQTIGMGVSEDIAGFTVPLCATIHMSGSALKIVSCALTIMIMEGLPYDTAMFSGFIMMLGISIVAAPGVPGGAIMASLGILGSILGFGPTEQALMIALYITMDSFGTACNVTGDGAIAIIINHYFAPKSKQVTETSDK